MSTLLMEPTLDETLRTKVASLTPEQAGARLLEIADSGDESEAAILEFSKLFFSPDAALSKDGIVL